MQPRLALPEGLTEAAINLIKFHPLKENFPMNEREIPHPNMPYEQRAIRIITPFPMEGHATRVRRAFAI